MEDININSGQVEIISPFGRVYLYTSKTAKTLVSTVYDTLSLNKRWDDPDYLSRLIFCRMVPMESWESDTGFGIGTQLYVDTNLLISIDTVKQSIAISSFGSGVDDVKMSIEDFVKNFYNNAQF
jgi:hypothetical protein